MTSKEIKQLQELIASLQKELEEKRAMIEKTNAQLKDLDRLKSDFIATISHELRTPLSITKEGINLVLDKIPGDINENQRKILVTAQNNVDRLAKIIQGLLDVAKAEDGRMQLSKQMVNIHSL